MLALNLSIRVGVRWRWVAISLGIIALVLCAVGRAAAADGRLPSRVVAFVTGSMTNASYYRWQPINKAEVRLRDGCMRRKGFVMPETVAPALIPISALLQTEDAVSVPPKARELSAAKRYGFGITAYVEAERALRRATPPPPITPAEEEALEGSPDAPEGRFLVKGIAEHTYRTTGCGPESYTALYGSPRIAAEAGYYPEDLELYISRHEQRVSLGDAVRRWSACFNKGRRSLRAASPTALRAALATRELSARNMSIAVLSAQERPIAVADLRCLYSSGYVEAEAHRARPIVERVLRPYVDLLERLMRVDAHAMSVARSIIAHAH